MAKKSVASMQKKEGKPVKAIRITKSAKSGAYTFEERILDTDRAKEFFDRKLKK